MKLPPALAPWRAQLERFPEELALALAPLVQRLAAAVGPLGGAYIGSEAPDGFDGVIQRGEYQRLLMSEWLLADEEPDEFLRRAAMHEHLFLRLAQREPRGCKRCLALFDAGPSQLGAPRLAHIAMLAVLERRALAAGAEFEFGMLQRPGQSFRRADVLGVSSLLDARSCDETSAEQVAAWFEPLPPFAPEDEVWWIGGARLEQLVPLRPGPRMLVRDPLRAENDRLEVELQLRERRHQLVLELPEPSLRTRLIRDPFQTPATHSIPNWRGGFRFSPDGRRVLVSERPLVYSYADSRGAPYAGSGEPRVFRPPEDMKLVALTWHRRHFGVMFRGRGGWFLCVRGKQYPVGFVGRKPEPPLGDADPCRLFLVSKRSQRALLLDAVGTLFRGELHGDGGYRFRPIHDRVLALDQRHGHFAYFAEANQGVAVGNLSSELNMIARETVPARSAPTVYATHDPVSRCGAFAVDLTASKDCSRWAIHGPGAVPEVVEVHNDHVVQGLVPGPRDQGANGKHDFRLLVRPSLTPGLFSVGTGGTEALPGFSDIAGQVALSPGGKRVAYRTRDGHICVRDVWTQESQRVIVVSGDTNGS